MKTGIICLAKIRKEKFENGAVEVFQVCVRRGERQRMREREKYKALMFQCLNSASQGEHSLI